MCRHEQVPAHGRVWSGTQVWHSSTEWDAVRFVSRENFRETSYPQPLYAGCMYRQEYRFFLGTLSDAADPTNVWLVRNPLTLTPF
jgi:hypothetical protein